MHFAKRCLFGAYFVPTILENDDTLTPSICALKRFNRTAILSLEPVQVNPDCDGQVRVAEQRLDFVDRRSSRNER
jgi:hypothetical protein